MQRAIRNEMKQMICATTVSFLELELKNLISSHQEIAWNERNDLSKKLQSQAFAKFSQNIVWAVYLSINIARIANAVQVTIWLLLSTNVY